MRGINPKNEIDEILKTLDKFKRFNKIDNEDLETLEYFIIIIKLLYKKFYIKYYG